MQRYEAILFDFDGVIMDSEPVHFDCWKQVLAPFGISLNWEEFHDRCVGISDYEMLEFLAELAPRPVSADRLWQEYDRKKELFRERMVGNPLIPPATLHLLQHELSDYKLAVVSSSARSEIEPLIEAAGLLGRFAALVFGEDVAKLKPDPEPYQLAARRLGVRTALVVEDSDAGETSGRAAGFNVLRIPHASQTAELVRQHLAEREALVR